MGNALYLQVCDYIQSRIASGEYPVGSQIPTEHELATRLSVSRPTVRQALDKLSREGYLIRVQGKGTFVSQPKIVHESTTFITGYRAESEKKHRKMFTKVLGLQVQKSPEHVARALELSGNEKVTCLIRLRHLENYRNNAPVVYTVLYVPCRLFPQMNTLDFTNVSFYDVLHTRNLDVRRASRKLEVIPPPPEVAAALEISPFEPVVFITSQGRMENGIPVEYTESYYPAGSSSFLIEVERREG